jgi:hypothetical protein
MPLWTTYKSVWRTINAHAALLVALSIFFLLLYVVLDFLSLMVVMPMLDAPIGQPGIVSWKVVLPEVFAPTLPATVLVTRFFRAVANPVAPREIDAVMPFYIAVFWRFLALGLLIGAGNSWLSAIGYVDPDRPDWPAVNEIAIGYLLAVGSALLALRFSPALAAAAVGQPTGLVEVWRSLSGRFLRFLVVFLGVLIPLYALSSFIGGILFSISMMIEEHLFFFLLPLFEALNALALTLSISAVLAVTTLSPTQRH